MRCGACGHDNEDGLAACSNCGLPLTAYGGQATGLAGEAIRAKLSRLTARPPIVPAMAAFDLLVALLGPVSSLLGRMAARPVTNPEGTNYISSAFGALGVAFAGAVLIPLALALVLIGWGTWTQRAWAWHANAAVLAGLAGMALLGIGVAGFLRVLLLFVCAPALILWLSQNVREWFGAS